MNEKINSQKPLSSSGHVIIVTAFFPPIPGGTSIVLEGLLKNIAPQSYTIATINPSFTKRSIKSNIRYLSNTFIWSSRVNNYWKRYKMSSARKKLYKLCLAKNPKYIIGVYPDFHFLNIAHSVSQALKIPLITYLHDTIAEGLEHSNISEQAVVLQNKIFNHSEHIFVISDGMKDLYKNKYNLGVDVLEHTYPESAHENVVDKKEKNGRIFWGGAIYSINQNSVKRVFDVADGLGLSTEVSSKMKKHALDDMGFNTSSISLTFYETRSEYLQNLCNQQMLLLALDWPEESKMHKDELGTIFPTKTIEYLHSGSPIIVHAPQDYYIAKFVKKHNCGIVVSDRSVESLEAAMTKLLSDEEYVTKLVSNAKNAARIFDHTRIQEKLISRLK